MTQQSIKKGASDALDLLFLTTVGISLRRPAKHPMSTSLTTSPSSTDFPIDIRECQRQLAAFDLTLAETTGAQHGQHVFSAPEATAAGSPLKHPPASSLCAVDSTASLASSASKASVGSNNAAADGKLGAASSKGSLPKSKSEASVADSSMTKDAAATDDSDENPHVYIRCNLHEKHSDIDACSLDWCAELHDIVLATETTVSNNGHDRAALCRMVHNLRLTKLAIDRIDAAFAADCSQLERLDVSDNALTTLSHLPSTIVEVDAYKNELHAVEATAPTPRLVHLGLGLNHFTTLPTLSHPQTLLSLDLSYNRITQLSQVLSGLKALSGLRHLFLMGNPVALCRGYRQAVLAGHPNLYVLDDIAVGDKEKDVLAQTAALLTDNSADLSVYVTAIGFPPRKPSTDPSAPTVTYEATVDVSPGLLSASLREEGAKPDQPPVHPPGAVAFEAPRVPLAVSLDLRDSVKFRPVVVRIYEVHKPASSPATAAGGTDPPPEPRPTVHELRVSVNVDVGGFFKPCSLEHRLGELTVAKTFQCIALRSAVLAPIAPEVAAPPAKGADKGAHTPDPVDHDTEITVTVKFVMNETERVRPSPSREQLGSKSKERNRH